MICKHEPPATPVGSVGRACVEESILLVILLVLAVLLILGILVILVILINIYVKPHTSKQGILLPSLPGRGGTGGHCYVLGVAIREDCLTY